MSLCRALIDLNAGLAEGAAIILRAIAWIVILLFFAVVYSLIGLVTVGVFAALIWLVVQPVWAAAYVLIAVLAVVTIVLIFGVL